MTNTRCTELQNCSKYSTTKKPSERVNKNAYTTNIPRSISKLHDKHSMDETAIWPKYYDHTKMAPF